MPKKPAKFIEPFAGGAIVGLTVAFEHLANMIVLVERDEQVGAVWHTIINTKDGADWLSNQIVSFSLTPASAQNLLSVRKRSIKERAFQTIVQNRISHGGILASGAGLLKYGENGKGIMSRWYPETLKKRILEIARVKDIIKFIRGDGFEIIRKNAHNSDAVFFIDPPYTASRKKAGSRLYKYHRVDHELLFNLAGSVDGDFLMTYDDADEVRALALKHRFETRLVSMSSTHHTMMNELIIGRDLSWVN